MCKCVSNNRPEEWQTSPCVRMIPPFPSKPVGGEEIPHKPIYVDACIANVLQAIWDEEIYTLNSCCGHNGMFSEKPSIVFEQNLTKEKADKIREIIKRVDDRDFKLMSWILTEV